MIVLLSINNGLKETASLLPFILKHSHNDVHDLRNERWEAREDSLNDTLCHLLKHKVNILQQIKSRLSELLHLRLDEIDEDVDRGETWDGVTLVEHDCLLDVLIRVLASCVVVDELFVEVVKVELDLSTTREFPLASSILVLVVSFRVKLSGNCVFVDCDEVCDHVPK
jgi:hypothetical protein